VEFKLSSHAKDMLKERKIPENWIQETLDNPDKVDHFEQNEHHYFKSISENKNRILHVIINPLEKPINIITAFFDRRERIKNEIKNRS